MSKPKLINKRLMQPKSSDPRVLNFQLNTLYDYSLVSWQLSNVLQFIMYWIDGWIRVRELPGK